MKKNQNNRAVLNHFWSMAIMICLVLCLFALIFSSVMGYTPREKTAKATPTPEATDALESAEPTESAAPTATPSPIQKSASPAALAQTADGGAAYLDAIYFFGDGALKALNDAGMLTGEQAAQQVWMPQSGVLDLNNLSTMTYLSPVTGNNVPAPEVVEVNHPRYVILYPSCDNIDAVTETTLKNACNTLITAILTEDPNTVIILSSLTPVAQSYTGAIDNARVNTVNGYLAAAAEANGVKYLDAAYAMADSDGWLSAQYTDDGIHLNTAGVEAWLNVVKTHAAN